MGKIYESIDDTLMEFIEKQKMFFVATAPLSGNGLVNVSPKGLDSFRVLDSQTVAYVDLTGSGIETVAHLKENGRIVIMFCSFDQSPKILRLHGRGDVIERSHIDFHQLQSHFPEYTGLRSFIRVRCDRISDSCGWGVPRYDFIDQRSLLISWAEKLGSEKITDYQRAENSKSLDRLPGLDDS